MQCKIFFEDGVSVEVKEVEELVSYIPPKALPIASRFFSEYDFDFRVAKSRASKYGDFRAPHQNKPACITVNGDLNPYGFLITLVHEMAHLTCWLKYKNKVNPHGEEWKKEYKNLMVLYIQKKIFPEDLQQAIFSYMNNPLASSCSDVTLMRVLKKYDKNAGTVFVEDIPENMLFTLASGRIFKKGEKQRKRFKCIDVANKRVYLVHPLAEATLLEN